MKIVEVTWVDASALGGWRPLERHVESGVMHVTTVGYLLQRKPDIVLLQSLGENDIGAESLTIPGKWVKKVRVLK